MAKDAKTKITEWNRMWASASFVGVLIVIGLPLWWKTTEVYRVALPYDKINSFDPFSHIITSELTVLADDEPTASEITGIIEKAFEDSDVIKLKINKKLLEEDVRNTLNSANDNQEALKEISSIYDLTRHNTFYVVQRKSLPDDVWLGGERALFFRDAKASQTLVASLKSWVYQLSTLEGARSEKAYVPRRTRFPPAPAYTVLLSVVAPTHRHMAIEFDARDAVEDYIGSFADELSVLHNFTLMSQWLYLVDFDFQAKEVKDTSDWGRHFSVSVDRLPLLLTRLETRAGTHVSPLPTINLALHAAPCHAAPLAIYDHDNKMISTPVAAFMSPKWGGVVLGNPTVGECGAAEPVYRPLVRQIMGAFIAHLRKLLGIVDTEVIKGAYMSPLRSVVPRRWEVDNLLRLRTLEQITSAERTLQSLAQLLGEISNIVINDEVGASINSAVNSISEANELMARGELLAAYKTSQQAFMAAETAFMEPSLLALLYFPDDQKYAIYIPLFLPIMFPVILSLKNLFLWFRGKPLNKEKSD